MSAPACDAIEYSTFSSAVDLYAVKGRDIYRMTVLAASAGATMTVRTRLSGDTNRVLNVAQGDVLPLAIRSIQSVSGVSSIRVEWQDF